MPGEQRQRAFARLECQTRGRVADLVAKHESRDPGHQLGEEDERQEHGILQREEGDQLQHQNNLHLNASVIIIKYEKYPQGATMLGNE
ncbi:hypothetical protein EYF80_047956 [Liparis tanakae]|uniref:Uncharacterized protein n=1 Tax=Liparis tanakae TaxID=230148 RepID=A0A4Z2FL52_9TELE|nr:hypothetical protein EYF80_047956 [Liparis tanakae]